VQKQILYVENDAEDVILIERALQRASIKVDFRVVATAELAIARLNAAAPSRGRPGIKLPDVVILDLNLRTSDGLDILKWLRQNSVTCAVPVIIYSDSADPQVKKEAHQLGISAFVPKQPDCQTLMNALLPLL
jgi:CheY-like chemotaxis protein